MKAMTVVAALLCALPIAAKTLNVGPGAQYTDIGAALSAASDGDVVSVAAGIYEVPDGIDLVERLEGYRPRLASQFNHWLLNLKPLLTGDFHRFQIADINRFNSFNRLCAYAGLAPRVSQSGNKAAFCGPLAVNRRKNLQWILLEVVFHFIKASPEDTARYEELKDRKGANTAKVIMARKMLKIIYHVLKEQRPYYRDEDKETYSINQVQSRAAAALCGV